VNSSPLPISAEKSSSSYESENEGASLKLKWLSVGELIVVETVETEKCDLGSSAAETAARRRRGGGTRVSSGSSGRGLEVLVAVRTRGDCERTRCGGGDNWVKMPRSFKEIRFSWLAKLSSSSASSAISSGITSGIMLYVLVSRVTSCRNGEGSPE
jgi:hypothetical protein